MARPASALIATLLFLLALANSALGNIITYPGINDPHAVGGQYTFRATPSAGYTVRWDTNIQEGYFGSPSSPSSTAYGPAVVYTATAPSALTLPVYSGVLCTFIPSDPNQVAISVFVPFRNYQLTPIPDDDYSLRNPAEPELLGPESFLVPKGKNIMHRFTLVGPPGQVWIDLPLTTSPNGGSIGLPPPAPPLATGVNLWATGNPATEYVISSDGLGGGTLMSGSTRSANRDDVAMKYRIMDSGSLDWTDLSKGIASWKRYPSGPAITQVTMTVAEIESVDPQSDDVSDDPGEPCVRVMINTQEGDSNRYHNTSSQLADRELTVKAVVLPHNLWGATLWLKTYDPPNRSLYEEGSDWDDNLQGQSPKGHLKAASGYQIVSGTEQTAGNKVYCCAFKETDSTGRLSAILEVSEHVSGDNYEVRVGVTPDLDSGVPPEAKTATLVAWKRYYSEVDRMAKPSAFSVLGAGYSPNQSEPRVISLVDSAEFFTFIDKEVRVFDFETDSGEIAIIESVDDVNGTITVKQVLNASYSADSAGVATVATDGSFAPDTSDIAALLKDAFVEARETTTGSSILPFRVFYSLTTPILDVMTNYPVTHFMNQGRDYHVWIGGVGRGTFGQSTPLGYALGADNRCFVFVETCGSQLWNRQTSCHEMGHNSSTNQVQHCTHSTTVANDGKRCIMNYPATDDIGNRLNKEECLKIRRSDKP